MACSHGSTTGSAKRPLSPLFPPAGGLSSSAAIVCASALAVLGVNGVALTKGEVADFTCKAERWGGRSGGSLEG